MHHIPESDRYHAVVEAKRVLKKNGYFMISEIGENHYIEAIEIFKIPNASKSKRLHKEKLRNLLVKANFKIISQLNRYDKLTKSTYDVAAYLYTQGIVRSEEEIIRIKLIKYHGENMQITLHRYHLVVTHA